MTKAANVGRGVSIKIPEVLQADAKPCEENLHVRLLTTTNFPEKERCSPKAGVREFAGEKGMESH